MCYGQDCENDFFCRACGSDVAPLGYYNLLVYEVISSLKQGVALTDQIQTVVFCENCLDKRGRPAAVISHSGRRYISFKGPRELIVPLSAPHTSVLPN